MKTSLLSPADSKKELHQNAELDAPLKSEVKKILDDGGTYVLVLFSDEVYKKKTEFEQAISEDLTKAGFRDPKFRVYTVDQIASFAARFPAQVASLNGYPSECLPYQIWAGNLDVNAPKIFVTDENRQKIIESIRDTLRKRDKQAAVFRLIGLSGLGKTRLAFEALSPDDLRTSVVYGKVESFTSSGVLTIIAEDSNLNAIIVADDCSSADHESLVRMLGGRGSRIGVISISQEIENHPSPTLMYKIDPLVYDSIEKLVENEIEGLPHNVVSRLSTFADGYPRIALLLAENYASSGGTPEDILKVNDEVLINKLIAGSLEVSSDKFYKTKRVLMGLAIFQKVGYSGTLSSESHWVAQLMDVPWQDFQEIVAEQRRRRILQGEYYVYVTPYLLSVHLVREWWETFGKNTDFGKFIETVPGGMRDRFLQWIPFATSTEPGQRLVKELLAPNGIFADRAIMKSDVGGRLFLKLAEADPTWALQTLKATIGTWTKDDLVKFTAGRRSIVYALEQIAMWRDLFPDAARLLLVLGEAENEPFSNNASGVFADLFSPGYGELAYTEASPEERFPILVEALNSKTLERKKLALRAFRSALPSRFLTRMIGEEYQGARPIPKLWTPKDNKPIIEYYRNVWTYLKDNLTNLEPEIRNDAVEVLLGSARDMVNVSPEFSDLVLQTIDTLSHLAWVDKRDLIKTVSAILQYESKGMAPDLQERWSSFSSKLTGTDFADQLKRYVGMDLLEDYFVGGRPYDEGNVQLKIQELARLAIEDPKQLEHEYAWLTTSDAQRGSQFGYELGKLDHGFKLLQQLVIEQEKTGPRGNALFLGGYMRAIFERDPALWDKALQTLSENRQLKQLVPTLTWMSGVTDGSVQRILSMVRSGDLDLEGLRLFKFGGFAKRVSEPLLSDCVQLLLNDPTDKGALTALDMFYVYYVFGEAERLLNKGLAIDVLLHRVFWTNPHQVTLDTTVVHVWKETGLRLLAQFPDVGPILAKPLLSYFGNTHSIIGGYHSDAEQVLTRIVQMGSQAVWKILEPYLGPPIDRRAYSLTQWLRGETDFAAGESAPLLLFDPDVIWQWVDGDQERRARYLASFVPPTLSHAGERKCLARELLAKYGDRSDVRNSFSANYSSEGWTGPESAHHKMRRDELEKFKQHETNPNVIRWIDEYLSILTARIEQAEAQEELIGYS